MERNIHDIQALIEDAFAGIRRDEDCTLHQGQFRDTFGDFDITEAEWNCQYDAEKLRDPETDWRDVPTAAIDECNCAQSHLTPQGWCFYLPAYLRRALELIDTDLWLPDSVVFHLRYEKSLGAHVSERFELLNDAQQRAVIAFLEFVHDYARGKDRQRFEGAALALKSYWTIPANDRPTHRILLLGR